MKMTKGADKTRVSKLIATELRYYNRPFAHTSLMLTTLMLTLMTVLFGWINIFSSSDPGREQVFLMISVALLAGFVVLALAYQARKRRQWASYTLVMGSTAGLYAVCAVAGFLLSRTLWVSRFEQELGGAGAGGGFVRNVLAFSLIAPVAVFVFYAVLLYLVPAKDPYAGGGQLFAFNVLSPALIVPLLVAGMRLSNNNTMVLTATITTIIFMSVMLYLAVRFGIKALLYSELAKSAARDRAATGVAQAKTEPAAEGEKTADAEKQPEDSAEDEITAGTAKPPEDSSEAIQPVDANDEEATTADTPEQPEDSGEPDTARHCERIEAIQPVNSNDEEATTADAAEQPEDSAEPDTARHCERSEVIQPVGANDEEEKPTNTAEQPEGSAEDETTADTPEQPEDSGEPDTARHCERSEAIQPVGPDSEEEPPAPATPEPDGGKKKEKKPAAAKKKPAKSKTAGAKKSTKKTAPAGDKSTSGKSGTKRKTKTPKEKEPDADSAPEKAKDEKKT